VVVAGKRAEVCQRDTEATEGDRGVEPPTAGYRSHSVVVDEVDQSLAADDDHDALIRGR
jgi:hypothetical protein